MTAFFDGFLTTAIGQLYRRGLDSPTPEEFPDTPDGLCVNAFLVQTGGKNVLIDTGSGEFFGPDHGKLIGALEAFGIGAHEVDDIILTHIHADHSGGLIVGGEPVFTNAELHIARTEASFWLAHDGSNLTDRLRGQIERAHAAIDPYMAEGRVSYFDDDGIILPNFSSTLRAGHTPGHISVRFESGRQAINFVGDIVHGDSVQFYDPSVTITFDYDQPAAAAARIEAFANLARNVELIAAAHLPYPGIGFIRREDEYFRYEPYSG
ncbi:MBL fold metallo-hydrolase [Agrobacterium larrymoorei]|uniref:MBL fold metallo-hydrolase n=1 Tax=Agrobacterium larrymoorei TaxID=160699 RepID=UPI001573AB16|nr:MBL fold metallo-hydrolase [Agrobacterium larrymoorei]